MQPERLPAVPPGKRELGVHLEGCFKPDGQYLLARMIGNRFAGGNLIHVARSEVENDPLPTDAPDTDLPPYWTVERTFTVQPDGSVTGCSQRESGKGIVPCEWPGDYLPIPDGRPKRVRTETRWAFQPDK